ncbi:MAG: DUF2911 domain-containing protein [Pyrinomonadaceae bacterium]
MFQIKRFTLSSIVLLTLIAGGAFAVSAQLRVPRPSQKASVIQTIGVTDLSITYSRPGVKGRKIWGDAPPDVYAKGEATLDDQNKRPAGMPIVPYGHVWRTGANEATQFVVTDDVLINGQPLAAGSYSLHTIPGKDRWVIVFNGQANQWGSFNYDPKNDTLRVKAKPQATADHQEFFAFTIDPTADNAVQVSIRWEKVRVPFTVEVKDVVATTLTKARAAVAAAKPDDWATPYNAAVYARSNKAAEDAPKWFEQSLRAAEEQLKVKETFPALNRKVNSLVALGRTQEAIAVAEKAVDRGKADKVDTAALEKRIVDMKAGKN